MKITKHSEYYLAMAEIYCLINLYPGLNSKEYKDMMTLEKMVRKYERTFGPYSPLTLAEVFVYGDILSYQYDLTYTEKSTAFCLMATLAEEQGL